MIDQVRPATLPTWFEAQDPGKTGVVLDVREAAELRTASVTADGFELLTIPMNQVPARVAELDPERALAILCHTGRRSQHVAMFLEGQGFTRLANVAGGIDAWSTERDPAVPRY
ncbi:MAG: rhodanese-like domain-containing protein [Ramlibacter sp.]